MNEDGITLKSGLELLTWKGFVEAVEKQLLELDIDENVEIWYIDIKFPVKGNPDGVRSFCVSYDTACGISVG